MRNFRPLVLIGALTIGLIAGWAWPPLSASARSVLAEDGVPVSVPNTCNSNVFVQVPIHRDYFLGRIKGEGGTCATAKQQLAGIALFRMDWTTYTLSFEKLLFAPGTTVSAGAQPMSVHHAFDPSVVQYNGELWVAFECAIGGASTCVGPLDWNARRIDPRRTTLVVARGDANPGSGFRYSASVPNLFVFNGRLYVYWAAIKATHPGREWQQITVRGMELQQEPSGLRRIWGAGSNGAPVASNDPSRNIEVLGVDPADPYGNQSADLKGVYADRNYVYVIASLGGRGREGADSCVRAKGTSYGCWRMQIFRSANPLERNAFNQHPLVEPTLPLDPAAYQRPFVAPDGTLSILGKFHKPQAQYPATAKLLDFRSNPARLISYPLPLAELRFR